MKLSIIISTFNRADKLEQLLEDLTYQHKRLRRDDAEAIEVLLIDNKSFDRTKEVAYKYTESTAITLKYFFCESYGLANSRNLAITQARGDLLAFLHDDVTLDDDWLKETYKLANNCNGMEVGVYGGRVVPMWQEKIPAWLNMEQPHAIKQEYFTAHSYGDNESYYPFRSELGLAEMPCGANFMARKEVFDNCGDFRNDLGPDVSGQATGLHDDYEFFEYLQTINIPMLYVPQSIVYHPIDHEMLRLRNINHWYYKFGKSMYWITHTDRVKREADPFLGIERKYKALFPDFTASWRWFGVPIYLYLKLVYIILSILMTFLLFNRKKRYWLFYEFAKTLGEIDGVERVNEMKASKRFTFKDKIYGGPSSTATVPEISKSITTENDSEFNNEEVEVEPEA